ncbi:uncharacterized protein VTP21DRAFT_4461 [Calcarisporiella thermophila]|uniref:uncharacterized protein n=1 Tax=Calcarisporiella thermophila TaxID=911321 RepID=UPI003742BCF7
MAWQPQQQGLTELLQLLNLAVAPSNERQNEVQQRLDMFNKIPDYSCYLIYILANLTQEDSSTRAVAGLLLKNNIKHFAQELQPDVLEYVKATSLQAVGDPDPTIRGTVGIVITTLLARVGITNWPQALNTLMAMLDSPDVNVVEGALGALQKICEDSTRELDQEFDGVRPLNFMIPKFISFFDSPHEKTRVLALRSVNQFIYVGSQSLAVHMDAYVAGLFKRATDPSSEVRVQVCQALVGLIEMRPDKLAPELGNVVEYMLFSTQDADEQVALEACEFWLAIAEQEEMREQLRPFLPRVIPVLLKGMVYTDMDIAMLGGDDDDDANVPDRAEDIKPRHHRAKTHGHEHVEGADTTGGEHPSHREEGEEDDDDVDDDFDDEDEDDFDAEWNLRKCSAAALDVFATVFHNDILETLLPLLKEELFSSDWKHRECGILALGAVADGCMSGVEAHLPDLVPYLLQSLSDPKPLVRSIACWTLGRYSRWCVAQTATPETRQKFFEPLLQNLLRMILDNNKRVQEAGCSAFATLEEEALEKLVPYLDPILRTLVFAFNKYQHKNLLILYDAIGTLADSVGEALNKKEYVELLMPPLIERWQMLPDDDTDLFPLLECFTAIATALGLGFQPFSPPVFHRCIKLVHSTLVQDQMHKQNPQAVEEPDKDFMVVALDLLSALAQALNTSIESLVSQSQPPLLSLLNVCLTDPVAEVRQSAYALVGDLAISCFGHIQPYLTTWMPWLVDQIDPKAEHSSVVNNAAWAGGEIALQWGQEIQPWIQPMLERLVPLMTNDQLQPTLAENVAIALGRLGYVAPNLVAPHLEVFFEHWCRALRAVRENNEKDSAFLGLCAMIQVNPQGAAKGMDYLFDAVASWENPSAELNEKLKGIMHGYKQAMGAGWEQYMSRIPEAMRKLFLERYGV